MAGSINLPDGPDPVIKASEKIGELGEDFQKKYSALYDLVEHELASSWKGSDYNSFKSKMNAEKIHFDSMYNVIIEYSNTLRNAINAHVSREEDSEEEISQINFDSN